MSRILCRICAAGKPGNSEIGSREPGREGVCWLAGCGELDAGIGSRELGAGNIGRKASADVWVHEHESGEQGDCGVC